MSEKFKEVPEIPKVNNIPEPDIENIESSKLEWGPDLGEMSWDEAQTKIAELNTELTEGEKLWRLPTTTELEKEFKNSTGFSETNYWSSEEDEISENGAHTIDMSKGVNFGPRSKRDICSVRVIR